MNTTESKIETVVEDIYGELKSAMKEAGHVVSEGLDLLVSDMQQARDFFMLKGLSHLGEEFHLFRKRMLPGASEIDTSAADKAAADAAAKAKADQEAADKAAADKLAADQLAAQQKAEADAAAKKTEDDAAKAAADKAAADKAAADKAAAQATDKE